MSITRPTRTTVAVLVAVVAATTPAPRVDASRTPFEATRWLVLVDDLHLDFRRTRQIRGALAAVIRPLVSAGVLLRLQTSGPSAVHVTTDARTTWSQLAGPLRQTTGNGLRAADTVRIRDTRTGRQELVNRARTTVANARALLDTPPDRPAVPLLVSHGYRTDIPEVSAELTELAALAGRARVPIVVLDPRTEDLARAPLPDPATWALALHHAATAASLAALAQQTGGTVWEAGDSLPAVFARLR